MSTKNDQDIGTKLAGFIPRMGNSPKFLNLNTFIIN